VSDVGVETITMRPTQEEENKKWFPLNIFTYRIGLDFLSTIMSYTTSVLP